MRERRDLKRKIAGSHTALLSPPLAQRAIPKCCARVRQQHHRLLAQFFLTGPCHTRNFCIVLVAVTRYTLPELGVLLCVLHDALAVDVTRSLALDARGKTLWLAVLHIRIAGGLP